MFKLSIQTSDITHCRIRSMFILDRRLQPQSPFLRLKFIQPVGDSFCIPDAVAQKPAGSLKILNQLGFCLLQLLSGNRFLRQSSLSLIIAKDRLNALSHVRSVGKFTHIPKSKQLISDLLLVLTLLQLILQITIHSMLPLEDQFIRKCLHNLVPRRIRIHLNRLMQARGIPCHCIIVFI